MADKPKSTRIIKKIKTKKAHGAHHGGSWKIAYADFTTALMAFFLLLWLITMVEPIKRAAIADFFRNFNLFQQSGRSFMEQASSIKKEVKTTVEPVTGENLAEKFKEELKLAIEQKLKELKEHIIVERFEKGVRIEIVDLEGKPLFPLGSSELTPKTKEILKVLSENIKDEPGKIAIEGHTDAFPFRNSEITNWELSTQRASSARRELEKNGVDPSKVAKVVGYADTMPLIKDNPKDPRNRRISITLLF